MTGNRGFVFAATGDLYVHLARRTARNLRAVAPEAQIDLFTDRDLADPVFDTIHRLAGAHARPKMEALRNSRFDRTVYLDADVIALGDPTDLFDLLGRADIIGVLEQYGNYHNRLNHRRPDIPASFRELNSGVMGVAKSDKVDGFLDDWHQAFLDADWKLDQVTLREALWDRPDILLTVLPMEYNLMHARLTRSFGKKMSAPRLLHITTLHARNILDTDPETPIALSEAVEEPTRKAIADLLDQDLELGARPGFVDRVAIALNAHPQAKAKARSAYHWIKRLRG